MSHYDCPCMEKCPLHWAMSRIGGKWKVQILCSVANAGTIRYNALRAKAATDVSGYFSSLLSGMSQEDRAMIAAAFQKLDDALLQAGTEQSGP